MADETGVRAQPRFYVMRLIIDSLIALMLAVILGCVLVHYRNEQNDILRVQQVHQKLATLQEQALYRGALAEVEVTVAKFPLDIPAGWFPDSVPRNGMVSPTQPWLDIAPAGDDHDNPPDPVIRDSTQAGFWYNPNRGIFRARVTPQFTEEETLKLYNRLNGTQLRWLTTDSNLALKPRTANTVLASTPNKPAAERTTLVETGAGH